MPNRFVSVVLNSYAGLFVLRQVISQAAFGSIKPQNCVGLQHGVKIKRYSQ